MFIKSTELNGLAVFLANVLRNFDPHTMFWDLNAPTVFPNCDEHGFSIPQDIRKPFGVQRILESLAKSAGYNSYKGLLEDCASDVSKKLNFFNVNIHSLNPNPRNAYYTAYWESFTDCLMQDIKISNVIGSSCDQKEGIHTLYQNINTPSSIKYAAYMGWGIATISKYNLKYYKDIKIGSVIGAFDAKSDDAISHYYPIAEAIVFSVLELELAELDKGSKYLKHYEIKDIPLHSFFKISQWNYGDLSQFLENLRKAVLDYFFVDMHVSGRKGFNNKTVNFCFRYNVLERYEEAKKYFNIHQSVKSELQEWAENAENDSRLYTHPLITQKHIMSNLGDQRELGFYALKSYIENNNSESNFLALTKQSWANYCLKFSTYPLGLLHNYDSSRFKGRIDDFLNQLIEVEVRPKREKEYFLYHYTLSNYDYICLNDDENVILPHRVTVRSEYELITPFAELAVQAEILQLLPTRMDFDYYTKLIGDASKIAFENNRGELLDPVINLKKIGKVEKPDLIIDFNFKNIVHQINVDPFVNDIKYASIYDAAISTNPKTGEPVEFETMFGRIDTTLIFNFNLTLVDTVFKMNEFYSTSDGFNTLELYIEYNLEDKSIEELDVYNLSKLSKKERNQYIKLLNFLIEHPQFNDLVFQSLIFVKNEYIKHSTSGQQLLDIMTFCPSEDLGFFYGHTIE